MKKGPFLLNMTFLINEIKPQLHIQHENKCAFFLMNDLMDVKFSHMNRRLWVFHSNRCLMLCMDFTNACSVGNVFP